MQRLMSARPIRPLDVEPIPLEYPLSLFHALNFEEDQEGEEADNSESAEMEQGEQVVE